MTQSSAHDEECSTILPFWQSNPTGDGQGDVATLLRRVADSIDARGDIDVADITFHNEVTERQDDLTITVYYNDQPRRR